MRFFVIKANTIKIILLMILCMLLLSINFGGSAFAQVYFNKVDRRIPIYEVETQDKKVAITFDAAWGADKTVAIMDILDEYNCKATFFLVGFWVEKYPDIVKQLYDRGFEIGTHSDSHPDLAKADNETVRKELQDSIDKIKAITGEAPKLFRAPFGSYNNSVIEIAESLGLTTIQWSVDSLDWKGISGTQISTNILSKAKSGSIILNHNNSDYILDALPSVLQCLREKGYTVTNVGDLIYWENYTINHAGVQKSK